MVEIIAQIIMGKDVALRSAAAVAVEGVDRSVHPAPRAPRASDAAERPAVAHEQVEQPHRVGRRPFALLPRATPADRDRQFQPHPPSPGMKKTECTPPLSAPAAKNKSQHAENRE